MEPTIEQDDIAGAKMFDQGHGCRGFPTIAPTTANPPSHRLLAGDIVEHNQAGLRKMAINCSPSAISTPRLAEGQNGIGRRRRCHHGTVDCEDAPRESQGFHASEQPRPGGQRPSAQAVHDSLDVFIRELGKSTAEAAGRQLP